MSTEDVPADTNETSKEDKVKIKLHLLFQQFDVEINRVGSRFQHGNHVNLEVLGDSYDQCVMLEEKMLKIREYVEAMVFSEEVGDIEVPKWACDRLPTYFEGHFATPTKGYSGIVRWFGLVNGYLKSMATHECFSEIQNNASRGWPESKRIKDRSISDPAEFFYGYLQEIDASIAAVKLGIKRAEIRERERARAHNERVIRERREKRSMLEDRSREDGDFGKYPSATEE